MRIRVIGAVAAAFMLAPVLGACATQAPRIAQTASGRPEATIANTTPAVVKGKLSEGCLSAGLIVESASDSQVECWKTMEGGDAILAQLLIGNSYSTTPVRHVRFTIIAIAPHVRVQAYQWVSTQMAFGQMQQMELNGNNQFNEIQGFLNRVTNAINPPVTPAPLNNARPSAKPAA